MPARLTPNQKDRLIDLGRRSRALQTSRDGWVNLSAIGGERTLDHLVEKGYAESREKIGPRGGLILHYRPTLAGWDWLAKQERATAATTHTLTRAENANRVVDGITPAAATAELDKRDPRATASDPTCRRCKTPDSWHSELDGQCPDDDGPHFDSVAAYDARETADCSIHGPFYSGFARCPTCETTRETETTLPALYSEAWPVPYAVAIAPREERDANEESRGRIAEAFGELDEAVCMSFRDAPATFAPESL
jgi:DNA-binding PadR family transcriptional regulator